MERKTNQKQGKWVRGGRDPRSPGPCVGLGGCAAVCRAEPAVTVPTASLLSSKTSQDRKLTSAPREVAKSPHSTVPEHHPHPISPYEHLLRGVSGVDLYRSHIPLAFDPTSISRGIPLDAGDWPGNGACCQGPCQPMVSLGTYSPVLGRGSRGPGRRRPSHTVMDSLV